jgi:hypothetical protein
VENSRLGISDSLRLVEWLSEAHPDIFKEFLVVNTVYNKANEQKENGNEFS